MSNELPCISLGREAVLKYTKKVITVVRVLVFSVTFDPVINKLVDDEFIRS